ncbi:MAG: hypothetical protein SLAVMIC_00132 [uncultured marine phage]|uniref:Uncharacterized protein n=1 Tax=uncultured marine phage TaxID=707152 RepID=A0A8D9FQT7_9VIRU|nr:MAG: hypothetical protein SLAVMIC_00132 [uncultured marine phage]
MKRYNEFIKENIGNPIVRSNNNRRFWLVTEATPNSELVDIITEVDAPSIFRIGRGSDMENDDQVEIFTYEEKEEAFKLANQRLKDVKGIVTNEGWYEDDYSSWDIEHLKDHLTKLNQSIADFFGNEPNPNYHDRGYQDKVEERNEVESEIEKRNSTNESIDIGDPDDIEEGDLVDFGAYGELYVCNPYYSDTYFWVTDDEDERTNSGASGWTILKSLAKRIIEPNKDYGY